MTKSDLKNALIASTGGAAMVTLVDVMAFLGKGKTYTKALLRDVDCIGEAKGKMYFAGDVAEAILRRKGAAQ